MTTNRGSEKSSERGGFEPAGMSMGELAGRMAGKATDVAMNLTGAAHAGSTGGLQ